MSGRRFCRASGLFLVLLLIPASRSVAIAPEGASRGVAPATGTATFDPVEHGRPNLRVFTDKDGLPQNAITSLVFDREGHLWAGTKDGAARYDGRSWTIVNLPREFGTNWVRTILVASDGSMWFGADNGQVARLEHDRWTLFGPDDGLPPTEVTCLFETGASVGQPVMWVGTGTGLACFEDGRWRREYPIPGTPEFSVTSMLETASPDGGRAIWVGTLVSGVARLKDGVWAAYGARAELPAKGVTCLLETTAVNGQRAMIAGTFDDDVLLFDGTTWRAAGDGVPPLRMGGVQSLLESRSPDGSPLLWAGTSTGLARFEGGRWLVVGPERGLPPVPIWSLARIDAPGGTVAIWAGTAGLGLVHWQLGKWSAFDTANGMVENSVYSLLVTTGDDGSRTLWVGTNDHGLSRLDRSGWAHENGPPGSSGPQVNSLIDMRGDDGERELWAGTHNALMRLRNGRWTVYSARHGASPPVNCLLPTRAPDGTRALWVGTNAGLVRFENGAFRPPDPALKLPHPRITSMAETAAPDGSTTLWLGTSMGLARFERGVTTVYDRKSGLPSDGASTLYVRRSENGRQTLWVGTPAGVAILDLEAPEASWTHLSTESTPALPNNMVYRIEEDARRRVYLFTNRGVARLTPRTPTPEDPSQFEIYTFTIHDGLPSNECNTGASAVDDLGRIWAGTIAGVAVFDPSREIDDRAPKPLVVQRALLPDTGRTLAGGDSLAHDENHVLFEFALLSYFRESDTRYRAQLVGYDEKPSEWSVESRRDYISLPPRDYRFIVWGRDVYGNVSGPVEVPFAIRRAPWVTWWAILLYTVAIGGLTYVASRYRMLALRRRNERLEEAIAERTTQLAHTVEELRESEHRALEANQAKSVFLANMSHELRTPLNAILGFAQLMERDGGLDRSHRESLDVITRSGEHLLGLINDVLSIAKIEAGKSDLVEQNFDLHELLKTVRGMIRVRAESKAVAVDLDLDLALPVVVRGDEGKLRQVLVNLLGNAVKFTEEGSITLRARWEDIQVDDVSQPRGRATFEVSDTGCGMSAEDLARLFESFVQTESGLRSQEGTGLGLVISRNFVRLMGGDLRVASTPGVGTTFSLDVPLGVASHADRRAAGRHTAVGIAPDSPSWRVLVVDDTEENRLLLVRLLAPIGFEVRDAVNGADAVEAWRSWRPDLIFMDMRMPVMDGLEATRRIRAEEGVGGGAGVAGDSGVGAASSSSDPGRAFDPETAPTPESPATPAPPPTPCKIVALTASAFEHEQDRYLEAGCDDYVPKPFRTETILAKLAEHLGVRYIYEGGERTESVSEAGSLTRERLGVVPAELVRALREALTVGDVEAALDVVAQVRSLDDALASDLTTCVRSFRFEEVLDWLDASGTV